MRLNTEHFKRARIGKTKDHLVRKYLHGKLSSRHTWWPVYFIPWGSKLGMTLPLPLPFLSVQHEIGLAPTFTCGRVGLKGPSYQHYPERQFTNCTTFACLSPCLIKWQSLVEPRKVTGKLESRVHPANAPTLTHWSLLGTHSFQKHTCLSDSPCPSGWRSDLKALTNLNMIIYISKFKTKT